MNTETLKRWIGVALAVAAALATALAWSGLSIRDALASLLGELTGKAVR